MRIFTLAAILGTVLACSVSSRADEELSGAQVLQKCKAAYAALPSYVGTTTTKGVAVFADGKTVLRQTATAHIRFSRPGKLRVEGKTAGNDNADERFGDLFKGQDYAIVSDSKTAWLMWALDGDRRFKKQGDLSSALSGMTGVAQLAPTTIPGLLALDWDFVRQPGATRFDGHEIIDGASCYKITVVADKATETFWIDEKTLLLHQMKTEMLPSALEEANREAQKNAKARHITENIPVVVSHVTLESFAIESTTADLDDALFQDPTHAPAPTQPKQ